MLMAYKVCLWASFVENMQAPFAFKMGKNAQ